MQYKFVPQMRDEDLPKDFMPSMMAKGPGVVLTKATLEKVREMLRRHSRPTEPMVTAALFDGRVIDCVERSVRCDRDLPMEVTFECLPLTASIEKGQQMRLIWSPDSRTFPGVWQVTDDAPQSAIAFTVVHVPFQHDSN